MSNLVMGEWLLPGASGILAVMNIPMQNQCKLKNKQNNVKWGHQTGVKQVPGGQRDAFLCSYFTLFCHCKALLMVGKLHIKV